MTYAWTRARLQGGCRPSHWSFLSSWLRSIGQLLNGSAPGTLVRNTLAGGELRCWDAGEGHPVIILFPVRAVSGIHLLVFQDELCEMGLSNSGSCDL